MNIVSFLKGDSTLSSSSQKKREIFFYLIFGGLTTLVNLVSFTVFDKLFGSQHLLIAFGNVQIDLLGYDVMNQTVAWIIAVIFAYVTNRIFVFKSKGPVFKEFIGFVSSRVATLLAFELGTFELFVLLMQNVIGIDKNVVAFSVFGLTCTYLYLVKLLNSIFVVIGNYILSKIFVFRTKKVSRKNEEIKEAHDAGTIVTCKECDRDVEK